MTALLHLARHGQTEWHAENRYAGTSDVSLTDEGREQARQLGRWAATAGLSAVVSSDLTRAVETAQIVAGAAGLTHAVEPALRESDFGRGEGLTRAEMAEVFPAELAQFLAAPASHPLPDGEPGAVASGRFIGALGPIADQQDAPVLVIAPTTVMRISLCRLLGIPLDRYRQVFPELGNATITTIALDTRTGAGAGAGDMTAAVIRYNSTV